VPLRGEFFIPRPSRILTILTRHVLLNQFFQCFAETLVLELEMQESKRYIDLRTLLLPMSQPDFFVHESSYVDQPCQIGPGTKIWHFAHIMKDSTIGSHCNIGQNVVVSPDVVIGNNAKIQNNVSLYTGVVLEDDVFCGPSCVFTNVSNPRSQVSRRHLYEKTIVRRGATIGANATIVCGSILGRYCFIAAGAVVKGTIPDYALMMGVPARQKGWMSRHGHRLVNKNADGDWICPETGWLYREVGGNALRCLNWDEEKPLEQA